MTTERSQIIVSGIEVEVVRKPIKNLHLGVYPPDGRVRVAVPVRIDDDAIRLAVITRLGWIRKQRQQFERQERQSQREMVTGESHYVQGRRYRLRIVEHDGPSEVRFPKNTIIELWVRPGTNDGQREALLQRWYRQQLRTQVPLLIAKWESALEVSVAEWSIRKMKTRWGTCNNAARRIWLNLELAKKPVVCLEYILLHEMVHLRERHHNERFQAWMDRLMPQWRLHREELNRQPLAHEEWSY